MSKPTLTYFSARGLVEPIRLLLADAAVDYTWNGFGMTVNGVFPEGLTTLKATGILDYGAVPLWEEGDLKLVQSSSILRHLARAHGYNGENEVEASKIDSAYEGCKDFQNTFRAVFSVPADQKVAKWQEIRDKDFPKWLGFFEALLKKSGTGFAVGKKISYADIQWASVTDEIKTHYANALDAYPLVAAHHAAVFARPNVAKYASDPARYPTNFSRIIPQSQ